MSKSYVLLLEALENAVKNSNRRLTNDIRSTIMKNYKGTDVKTEVRIIMNSEIVSSYSSNTDTSSGNKMKVAELSLQDFEKKPVTPTLKNAVARDGVTVFNPHKAMLEMDDVAIMKKMGDNIESATAFINRIRIITGQKPLKQPKEFTNGFMTSFRGTLKKRISMTEEELEKAQKEALEAEEKRAEEEIAKEQAAAKAEGGEGSELGKGEGETNGIPDENQ